MDIKYSVTVTTKGLNFRMPKMPKLKPLKFPNFGGESFPVVEESTEDKDTVVFDFGATQKKKTKNA